MNEMKLSQTRKTVTDIISFTVLFFSSIFLYSLFIRQPFTNVISETYFVLVPVIYVAFQVVQAVFTFLKRK